VYLQFKIQFLKNLLNEGYFAKGLCFLFHIFCVYYYILIIPIIQGKLINFIRFFANSKTIGYFCWNYSWLLL